MFCKLVVLLLYATQSSRANTVEVISYQDVEIDTIFKTNKYNKEGTRYIYMYIIQGAGELAILWHKTKDTKIFEESLRDKTSLKKCVL